MFLDPRVCCSAVFFVSCQPHIVCFFTFAPFCSPIFAVLYYFPPLSSIFFPFSEYRPYCTYPSFSLISTNISFSQPISMSISRVFSLIFSCHFHFFFSPFSPVTSLFLLFSKIQTARRQRLFPKTQRFARSAAVQSSRPRSCSWHAWCDDGRRRTERFWFRTQYLVER